MKKAIWFFSSSTAINCYEHDQSHPILHLIFPRVLRYGFHYLWQRVELPSHGETAMVFSRKINLALMKIIYPSLKKKKKNQADNKIKQARDEICKLFLFFSLRGSVCEYVFVSSEMLFWVFIIYFFPLQANSLISGRSLLL